MYRRLSQRTSLPIHSTKVSERRSFNLNFRVTSLASPNLISIQSRKYGVEPSTETIQTLRHFSDYINDIKTIDESTPKEVKLLMGKMVEQIRSDREKGIEPAVYEIARVLTQLKSLRLPHLALDLLTKLRRIQVTVPILLYNVVIGAFCGTMQITFARRIFMDLDTYGVKPDEVTYNTLITFYAKTSKPQMAQRYFNEMVEAKVVPSSFSYDLMVLAYASVGDTVNASNYFKLLRDKYTPTRLTFHHMMRAFAIAKDPSSTLKYFEMMQLNSIIPTTATYSIIILAYARVADAANAERYYEALNELGKQPDRNCKIHLLLAYSRANKEKEFISHATSMIQEQEPLNLATFKILRHGLTTFHAADVLWEAWNKFIETSNAPEARQIEAVIHSFLHCKDYRARELLDIMVNKYEYKPSLQLMESMLTLFHKQNDIKNFKEYYDKLSLYDYPVSTEIRKMSIALSSTPKMEIRYK